jgi:hypothetical protein
VWYKLQTPVKYVDEIAKILKDTLCTHRGTCIISDTEYITRRLSYIAETSSWLWPMMSIMYTSIAGTLRSEQANHIASSRNFQAMLKTAKKELIDAGESSHGTTVAAPSTTVSATGKPAQHSIAM